MTHHYAPCAVPETTRVRRLLGQGLTQKEIRAKLGVSRKHLEMIVEATPLPSHLVYLTDWAREQGLAIKTVVRGAQLGAYSFTEYGGRHCLTRQQRAAIEAHFAGRRHLSEFEHWLTPEEVEREWRRPSASKAWQELKEKGITVRRETRLLGAPRNTSRYHPGDVLAAAKHLRQRLTFVPRGSVTSAELAVMCGVSKSRVNDWARSHGCPHGIARVGTVNRMYLNPEQVAKWLTGSTDRKRVLANRTLHAALGLPQPAPILLPSHTRFLQVLEQHPGVGLSELCRLAKLGRQTGSRIMERLTRLGYLKPYKRRQGGNRWEWAFQVQQLPQAVD